MEKAIRIPYPGEKRIWNSSRKDEDA